MSAFFAFALPFLTGLNFCFFLIHILKYNKFDLISFIGWSVPAVVYFWIR